MSAEGDSHPLRAEIRSVWCAISVDDESGDHVRRRDLQTHTMPSALEAQWVILTAVEAGMKQALLPR